MPKKITDSKKHNKKISQWQNEGHNVNRLANYSPNNKTVNNGVNFGDLMAAKNLAVEDAIIFAGSANCGYAAISYAQKLKDVLAAYIKISKQYNKV